MESLKRATHLFYCLTPDCGGWLAVVVDGGRAIDCGGGEITQRTRLYCKRCKQFRVWIPLREAKRAA